MIGGLTPLKLKPVPLVVIWEIVRAEPPEFVRVSESVWLLPVATLPKLRLVGFALKMAGVTPVPDNAMFSAEFDALLTIARLPVRLPAACGEKTTLNAEL